MEIKKKVLQKKAKQKVKTVRPFYFSFFIFCLSVISANTLRAFWKLRLKFEIRLPRE